MFPYPMRCDIRRTENTTALLTELHGSQPGFDKYVLAAWTPLLGEGDVVSLPRLAALLDQPLALRKARAGRSPARRLTWHCALRNTSPVPVDDGSR